MGRRGSGGGTRCCTFVSIYLHFCWLILVNRNDRQVDTPMGALPPSRRGGVSEGEPIQTNKKVKEKKEKGREAWEGLTASPKHQFFLVLVYTHL